MLRLPDGGVIFSTEDGNRSKGRLVLQTSREHDHRVQKLKPLWKISYRTLHQMIGAKPVSDLVPTTPGSNYIYGFVELAALEPTYVEHGGRRPKDGPLVEALDHLLRTRFVLSQSKSPTSASGNSMSTLWMRSRRGT